jgi:hypothetical protein
VSLTTQKYRAQAQASAGWDRTRQAATQAAGRAKNAGATAAQGVQDARDWAAPRVGQGIYQARGWAAPRIDQAGQLVAEIVAPKVSEILATTAQRVDPSPPPVKRSLWPQLVAAAAVLAAAGGVAAAILRGRSARTSGDTLMAEETAQAATEPDGTAAEERVMADGDAAGNAKKARS